MPEPTVLIVEDDDAIAYLFTEALSDDGYVAVRAASPDEALALLATPAGSAVRIVLSNPFSNPYVEPYAWLDRLRQHTCAAMVICSGYPATLYADHRARGYAAFLQEPFDLQDLMNLLASLHNGTGE